MTRRLALFAALGFACVAVLGACGQLAAHVLSPHHPVWCAFHGWRAYHDLQHHHPGWGAFQLWRAVHHCGRIA